MFVESVGCRGRFAGDVDEDRSTGSGDSAGAEQVVNVLIQGRLLLALGGTQRGKQLKLSSGTAHSPRGIFSAGWPRRSTGRVPRERKRETRLDVEQRPVPTSRYSLMRLADSLKRESPSSRSANVVGNLRPGIRDYSSEIHARIRSP